MHLFKRMQWKRSKIRHLRLPDGGITCTYSKECSGKGPKSDISGYLMEVLHALIQKNAVEKVQNQTSPAFFNIFFLVPKTWQQMVIYLSSVNKYLKSEKITMETPESIGTPLQKSEWVVSIDFWDPYFHIPLNPQCRKNLGFHVQVQFYQFKALPFGMSTAPM